MNSQPVRLASCPTMVAVLLCGAHVVAQAQVTRGVAQTVQAQTIHAPAEAELPRLRAAPQLELQRLQRDLAATCQVPSKAAECDRKKRELNRVRPQLESKAARVAKHEMDARAGVLVAPGKKHPSGSPCAGCHTSPGSAPAQDPLPKGLGTAGGMTPLDPQPGAIGTQPSQQQVTPSIRPSSSGTQDPLRPGVQTDSSSGGKFVPPATRCFIATAAFGSADAPEVLALRRFRDQHLAGRPAGDWFIRSYYRVSPPIADAIAERPALRAPVRWCLQGVVFAIDHPGLFAMLLVAGVAGLVALRRPRRVLPIALSPAPVS